MIKEHTDLERTAMYWWLSKRPIKWTAEQHLQNPTIDCVSDEERELAKAVANLKLRP